MESVHPGQPADQAGLKPGDHLLSWQMITPAESAGDDFVSPYDWLVMDLEYRPRGSIRVTGFRGEDPIQAILGTDDWGMEVQPYLFGPELERYRAGVTAIASGTIPVDGDDWFLWLAELNAVRDAPLMSWLQINRGYGQLQAGLVTDARASYEVAAGVAGMHPDPAARAWFLLHAGNQMLSHSHMEEAQLFFRNMRDLCDTDSHPVCRAVGSRMLGIIELMARRYPQSIPPLREAEELLRKHAPESLVTADVIYHLGYGLKETGDLDGAETLYREALAMKERLASGTMAVIDPLVNLATLELVRDDVDAAERYALRALEIVENLEPEGYSMGTLLNNLAGISWRRGDLYGTEQYLKRSLAVREKLGSSPLRLAVIYNNLGSLLQDRGDFEQSELFLNQALALRETHAPGTMDLAYTLNNLGTLAHARLDYDTARSFFKRSLQIRESQAPGSLQTAILYKNLGDIDLEQKEPAAAMAAYEQALEIYRKEAPGSIYEADVLRSQGNAAFSSGNRDGAETFFRNALDIVHGKAPGSVEEAGYILKLGQVVEAQGSREEARKLFQVALTIYSELVPGSRNEMQAHHALGKWYADAKQYREALSHYIRAVEALEQQISRLGGGRETAERYAAEFAELYRELIRIQVILKDKTEAFHTSERFRARQLLNMMAERDLIFDRDAPPDLLRDHRSLGVQYDRIHARLSELNPEENQDGVFQLTQKLQEIHASRKVIAEKLKEVSPRLAALSYPEPLDLKKTRPLFGKKDLLLSYITAHDQLFIFSLMNGGLSVDTVPVSRDDLAARIRRFRAMLINPASDPDTLKELGYSLYSQLLEPVGNRLRKADHVVICPDGPLHYLPYSALVTPRGTFLAEETTLSRIISATVFQESLSHDARTRKVAHLAAFGDPVYGGGETGDQRSSPLLFHLPSLPATRREVESIAGYFEGQSGIFLGPEAREEVVKHPESGTTMLHLAVHGTLNDRFPLDSGLALSRPSVDDPGNDNGLLQAWEIFEQLRIDAELVTLSACDTGMGSVYGGEGLIGLSRAFLFSGADAVVASLWKVDDEATADLMIRFYRYLNDGLSRAGALRRAQVDMINSQDEENGTAVLNHPFYWAAFQLNGDWK